MQFPAVGDSVPVGIRRAGIGSVLEFHKIAHSVRISVKAAVVNSNDEAVKQLPAVPQAFVVGVFGVVGDERAGSVLVFFKVGVAVAVP